MSKASSLSLAHRAWRALPARARRDFLQRGAMMLATKADPAPPAASRGVIVAGEMARVSGLGEAARLMQSALAVLAVLRGTYPLHVGGKGDPAGLPADAALLLHVNAPSIPLMLAREPASLLRGRLVIGMWNWELPVVPTDWRVGLRFVHEIWAPSAFTAAAFEPLAPGRVRLVPYPLALIDQPVEPDRAALGLPDDVLLVSFIANLGASFVRKNPLAAIAAFRAAFGADPSRLLVLKLAGGEAFPADLAKIRAAMGDAPNIRLESETWSSDAMHNLIACSDIVLSLHCAEGFGLVLAEAMLRGVPVVATGWSGNMQFMDESSAALVPMRLEQAVDDRAIYDIAGGYWAMADIEAAARSLRQLADDPAVRRALGARGQAFARAALDGAALRAALQRHGI
ncbi:MAG TPA: glycosyltransferase [Acetobacteraceae bacterium]|nr:glycosyltransferase [Acetobacteraceae bacterium]